MDVYKAPKSDLGFNLIDNRPNILWRVFFWINVILMLLVPLAIFSSTSIHVLDYIDLFISSPLVLFCLFSYAYSKKTLRPQIYSLCFYTYVLWVILYEVIAPFILGIPSYGEVYVLDSWVLLTLVFVVPSCIAMFRLSKG